MFSLYVSLFVLLLIVLTILGFAKKIKSLKIISLACFLVLLLVFLSIFYINRTQVGNAFLCDSKDSPISSCTYVSNVRYHYDSMDGIYYLEEINHDYVKFSFKANDCVLKSFNNKIGECKDTSGKSWAIILSGGRP